MRYTCDEPGYETSFVEFSPRWSAGQVKRFFSESEGGDHLALLRDKITALHLDCAEGEPITDPANLTPEDFERVDFVVARWFSSAQVRIVADLSDLGEAAGRRLYAGRDKSTAPPSPTQS